MKRLKICFHGTKEKHTKNILKSGFKKGTYFAKHLEDAVCFGGGYIFEVVFINELVPDNWQFTITEKIKPNKIISLYKFSMQNIKNNSSLRSKVFQSNLEYDKTK